MPSSHLDPDHYLFPDHDQIKLHQQYSSVVHHQSVDASADGGHPPAHSTHPSPNAYQSLLHPTPTAHFGSRHSRSAGHFAQPAAGPTRRRLGVCFRFCCRLFVRRYKERSKRIDVVSRLVGAVQDRELLKLNNSPNSLIF